MWGERPVGVRCIVWLDEDSSRGSAREQSNKMITITLLTVPKGRYQSVAAAATTPTDLAQGARNAIAKKDPSQKRPQLK
jgi:hypothetical protein